MGSEREIQEPQMRLMQHLTFSATANEALRWAAPRFLVYVITVIIAAALFAFSAFIYSQFLDRSISENGLPSWHSDQSQTQNDLKRDATPDNRSNRLASEQTPNTNLWKANPRSLDDKINWQEFRIGPNNIRVGRKGDTLQVEAIFSNIESHPMKVLIDTSQENMAYIPGTTLRWPLEAISGIRACSFGSECISQGSRDLFSVIVEPKSSHVIVLQSTADNLPSPGTTINVRISIAALTVDPKFKSSKWQGNLLWEPVVKILELPN